MYTQSNPRRVRLAVLGALAVLVAFVAPLITAGMARAAATSYSFNPDCPPVKQCQQPKPVTVVLTVKDALGNAMPFEKVNLSFQPAPGAPAGRANVNGDFPDLGPAPQSKTASKDGTIRINYTPGGATTGADVITAADPTNAAITAQESF